MGLAFRIQGCGCKLSGLSDFSQNYAFLMHMSSAITGFLLLAGICSTRN